MTDQSRVHLNFEKEARRIFSFLRDLGYVEVELSPTIVRYRKGEIEVEVFHEPLSFEIGAIFCGFGVRHPISWIIRANDPVAGKQYRDWAATTPEDVVAGLERLASLMKRYGEKALSGDKEYFLKLERQGKSWSEEYALDVLAKQVRPRAEDAFRRGDYATAVKLYAQIRSLLSPAEIKKLAFSEEHINDKESD